MNSLSNDGNNNWLGFSLSPQMENNNHNNNNNTSVSSVSVPLSFSQTPSHINYNTGNFYGSESENAAFFSSLSMMPLKSDGSLCIMEAFNRSHPQQELVAPTPKLEDFFGHTHMALSLDSSMYYQNENTHSHSQDFLTHLQEKSTHHHHQQIEAAQHFQDFGGAIRGQEVYHHQEQGKSQFSMEDNNNNNNNNNNNQIKNWHALDGESGGGAITTAMGYNGDFHSLSLSMSPGSQSSSVNPNPNPTHQQIAPAGSIAECLGIETKKRGLEKVDQQKQIVHRKSLDTFGQRTSQYRGVTRHRWTGRYEAHLWDNSCKKEGQSRKGRQVYLGGYDNEEKAARAYDLAALKYWGPSTHINFSSENYLQELEEMKNMTRQEYVAHLRRKSSGFSRGASIYRGVTRHHQHGRWQARIGRVAGNKDLYLGTFSTQEEAAEAYDIAAIKFRGVNAVTNFDISRYDVERIMASNNLLAGEQARRNKDAGPPPNNNNNVKVVVAAEEQPPSSCFESGPTAARILSAHMANSSSLVTSVESSRECNPDKVNTLGIGVQCEAQVGPAKMVGTATTNSSTSSWISSAQLRLHVPVFAAWTDNII